MRRHSRQSMFDFCEATPGNSAAAFGGSFPSILRFRKLEIHKVFFGQYRTIRLRRSLDLLPRFFSLKNLRYIQYPCVFQISTWDKISQRSLLPHYAVLPSLSEACLAAEFPADCSCFTLRCCLQMPASAASVRFLIAASGGPSRRLSAYRFQNAVPLWAIFTDFLCRFGSELSSFCCKCRNFLNFVFLKKFFSFSIDFFGESG